MEIIHVTALYQPHLGGAELVAQRLASLLAQRHDVTVYTSAMGRGDAPRYERTGRLTVFRDRAVQIGTTPVVPRLSTRLLRHRPTPDIVHVYGGVAVVRRAVHRLSDVRQRHADAQPPGDRLHLLRHRRVGTDRRPAGAAAAHHDVHHRGGRVGRLALHERLHHGRVADTGLAAASVATTAMAAAGPRLPRVVAGPGGRACGRAGPGGTAGIRYPASVSGAELTIAVKRARHIVRTVVPADGRLPP